MTGAKRRMNKGGISAIALLLLLLLMSSGALALGLGEARVESFLNQPLDVRMRLLDVSENDLDSLTVTPASPQDFERLGLMSSSLALGVQIEVDRSVSPAVVRVTTARPVTDPVVQLLVDARWASGRMLREYTLFIDPPTVAVEPPAPAPVPASQPRPARPDTTPQRPASPPRQSTTPAPPPAERPRAEAARPVAASAGGRYGPVASGETLWSIASANLPASGVDMNQMMIAVVELNPSAFRDRNINRLLRGAELQMPDAEQVRALDAAAAAAEVAAQNRAFRGRAASDLPVTSAAGRDSSPAPEESPPARDMDRGPEQAETADDSDYRLSLVPPGDTESGSGLDEDAAEVAELRQRLARSEEELYAARQEAEDFQSRVEDLEAAIRDNPRGIGLRDAELARLEATLRAAREATREGADPQTRADVSERLDRYLEQYESAAQMRDDGSQLAAQGLEPERLEGELDAQQDDAAMLSSEQVEDPAEAAPERVVTEAEETRGLLGRPVLLLIAGLVVLLVILAIVRVALRRSRTSTESAAVPKRTDTPREARRAEDPIQSARARLAADPENLAAHLALLQTLATDGHQDEFGEALETMYGHVDSDSRAEWLEALELAGRVVPGHSLVKGSSDWVAEPAGDDEDKPASELDEESEVDDLMTRLGEDMDESDDRDWLEDDSKGEGGEADGPLLRDDKQPSPEEESSARDKGNFRFTGTEVLNPIDAEDDSPVDFGEWDDAEKIPESSADHETSADAPQPDRESAETDQEDDRMLDWLDEDKPETQPESELDNGDQEDSEPPQDEDDIFAQSDDDIDVKLDLAKAYLSWNSVDSARTLLEEVVREGNSSQQQEASQLLNDISDSSED